MSLRYKGHLINLVLIMIIAIEVCQIITQHFFKQFQNPKKYHSNCILNLLLNSSRTEKEELMIKSSNLALLLYYPQSFPCPYFNDREELILPEVNRVAQYLRSIGSVIIFKTNSTKNIEINEHFNQIDEWDTHKNLMFQNNSKSCFFKGFDKKPMPFNEEIHQKILLSSGIDVLIQNFNDAVSVCHQKKVKFLLIAGMHSNEWAPFLIQILEKEEITPIFIHDISDVSYSHFIQRTIFPTHNDAIYHFNSFLVSKNVRMINHFDILSNFFTKQCKTNKILYDINTNTSHHYPYDDTKLN